MKGFLIRLFATNRLLDENDGIVSQSVFTNDETKEVLVRQVGAYAKREGELARTPSGRNISFDAVSMEVQIETTYFPFDRYNEVANLEAFLMRKYIYLATRWTGQSNENLYPREIPNYLDYAVRLAISEITTVNDEGYLFLRIKGVLARW